MMNIKLEFCNIVYTDFGCRVVFKDGSWCDAIPHDTHHYHVIAHRLGYQDDIMAYCREHEFAHEFIAERFTNKPSVVLWNLAHHLEANTNYLYEEIAAQMFQRWLHTNERPILSGMDWDQLKRDALELLIPDLDITPTLDHVRKQFAAVYGSEAAERLYGVIYQAKKPVDCVSSLRIPVPVVTPKET